MRRQWWGLVLLVLLLALASSAWAGSAVRCQTFHEPTLNRLQTLCADGTRAVSTWSPTLQRWDTTVTPAPTSPDFPGTLWPQPKAPRR